MDLDLQYPTKQKPASRETTLLEKNGWKILTIEDRVDAFNTPSLVGQVESILDSQSPFLILNLETTSFMSIPFIKTMASWAQRMKKKALPIVLLRPSEKIKRQIDIFASLDLFYVARTEEELPIKSEPVATL